MYLIPGTTHAVTWNKQNLLDDATYYVRAVIRDTRTEAVLATFNLTDLGNGRFSKQWNVVQDPTGRGREIEIEKTVYEDADYTVVSAMYGRWLDQYIINDLKSNQNFGGQSGSTIDYNLISEICARQITEALKTIKPADPVDLSAVLGEIGGVKQTLGERLREILKLGSKVDGVERLQKTIDTNAKYFIQSAEELQKQNKQLEKMVDVIPAAIERMMTQIKDEITEMTESHGVTLADKSDTELTYVVDKFKEIMVESAKDLSDTVSKTIAAELKKPLRVQAVQDMQVVREEEQKKPDKRIANLLSYEN